MSSVLPLFFYPTTWVYVDDDKTLLKTIGSFLSNHNHIKLFDSPNDCFHFFSENKIFLSASSFIKCISEDENYGLLRSSPMDFDVTQISKLEKNKNESEISVVIIDYQMNEMDGFTLAEKIQNFPVRKILLTGNVQEKKAVEGFNNSLIQRFVQKGQENTSNKLLQYLQEQTLEYFCNITMPLLSYLESENKMPLSDPTFIDYFETYIQVNKIKEYYLIDKEGSYLCINEYGKRSCLIVRTPRSINNLLNIYKIDKSIEIADLTSLKNFEKIPFFGISVESWEVKPEDLKKYLYSFETLEGREKYFICTVNLT